MKNLVHASGGIDSNPGSPAKVAIAALKQIRSRIEDGDATEQELHAIADDALATLCRNSQRSQDGEAPPTREAKP